MSAQPQAVDIPEIQITLRAGRVHVVRGQRVLVVEHVYGKKPRARVLGPAYEHVWHRKRKGVLGCSRCGEWMREGEPKRSPYCLESGQQEPAQRLAR